MSYISLVLSTSTLDEFFEFYEKLVPNIYVPTKNTFLEIVQHLQHYSPIIIMKHLPRLWSDISTLCISDLSLKLKVVSLMKMNVLPADSPLKTVFMDAAWDCWETIQVGLFIIVNDKKVHVIKINSLLLTERDQYKTRNIYST